MSSFEGKNDVTGKLLWHYYYDYRNLFFTFMNDYNKRQKSSIFSFQLDKLVDKSLIFFLEL